MRNEQHWRETKFIRRAGHWRPNPDPDELAPGSRLTAALILETYTTYLPRYARGHLADLGCGKVPYYAIYRPHVERVTCADWPQSFHGRQHLDVACDLARALPFRDECFDTVLLSDVLEHVPEPTRCLEEIERVLAPDGILLMNTPFLYWLHEIPHDYYRYTEFALRSLLRAARMELLLLEPIGGSPEVFVDFCSKHLAKVPLLGSLTVSALARLALRLRRLGPWRRFSAKSSRLFPLGYFVVARKPPRKKR